MLDFALVIAAAAEEDSGVGIVEPKLGLMVWTLVVFGITFYLLKRLAFGRIAEAIDERRRTVRENLESAERSRAEAQGLLDEYRTQLAAARHESSDIVERARRTGEELQRQMREELAAAREKGLSDAQAAIQAETRQALDQIKNEVADLTLLATEKVVGRALDQKEQQRLIDEALGEVDFSRLRGDG
jgi:F-type H+-transporting ATPase subunit b